jgi:hypothetical membrane protein
VRLSVLTSALAPLVLLCGLVLGAAAQPGYYSSFGNTISALAARGATDRWIMTTAFVLLGLCHLGTALGTRSAVLALGGIGTALLAVAPEPVHGSSDTHQLLATIALIALALWPLPRDRWVVLVLSALLIWFLVALQVGSAVGLSERCVAAAEALWPIVVVRRIRLKGRAA